MLLRCENMRLVSVANSNEHWATVGRRNRAQTQGIDLEHSSSFRRVELPVTITLTRVGKTMLDDDNLRMAFKHIRDYLANTLLPHTQANQHGTRGDDSSDQIRWQYGQRQGPYAVEMFIQVQERCPHGAEPGDCQACDVAGDIAFDADREDKYFGG